MNEWLGGEAGGGVGGRVTVSFTKTESISRRGGSEAVSLVSETLLEMRVD